MIKKLMGVAMGTGLLLATALPTFAATTTTTCENNITGALSRNRCIRVDVKAVLFKLDNNGGVTQNVGTSANTGGNSANYNTVSGGGIESGIADALVASEAKVNDNNVDVSQTDPDNDNTLGNNTTGYDSRNTVLVLNAKVAAFSVSNYGNVNHIVNTSANSGNNSASYNTVGGTITTGDAVSTSSVNTSVNTNNITISQ